MSAFKFDAARALAAEIEAIEREQTVLAASLPRPAKEKPAPYIIARRRRHR